MNFKFCIKTRKYLIFVFLKYSILLIPGIATLNRGFLAFAYGFALIYLFLGIAIVAEIFMEAIEKITSKKEIV
tara:strand:- start:191 stop:409 length:219 start_codon:yes stop_codon:yes gene_type:complete